MLGDRSYAGETAMGPMPWSIGADMSWVADAAMNASLAQTAAWAPWALQCHEDILRVQHLQYMEMWKQLEESRQALLEDSWQASAADDTGGFGGPPLLRHDARPEMLEQQEEPEKSPKLEAAGINAKKGGMSTPLSSLPPPLRVTLGPEPMPLSHSLQIEQKASDNNDTPELPPGLLPPPGLTLARAASLPVPGGSEELDAEPTVISETSSASQIEAVPGMWIGPVEVNRAPCIRAEWRIEDFRAKLQACMGRPLVSPPFTAHGLPNLRLMVFPDAREAVKTARSRDRKGIYASMVKKGPLHGALRLKVPHSIALNFHLTVGDERRESFCYDFSKQAIHGCDDFGVDWLKQVDDGTDCIRIGVEILEGGGAVGYSSAQELPPGPLHMYSLNSINAVASGHRGSWDQLQSALWQMPA